MKKNTYMKKTTSIFKDSGQLIKHFPHGIDFKIPMYDPIVSDTAMLMERVSNEENVETIMFGDFMQRTVIRGAKRHFNIERRIMLQDAILALDDSTLTEVEKHQKYEIADTLEDESINPMMILFVWQCYMNYLQRRALQKLRSNAPEIDARLRKKLLASVNKDTVAPELLRDKEALLDALCAIYYDSGREYDHNYKKRILKYLRNIPGYDAAATAYDIVMTWEHDLEEIIEILKDAPVWPCLSDYLLNEIEKEVSDYFDRWNSYQILSALNNKDAFHHMQNEFTNKEHWREYPGSKPVDHKTKTPESFYPDLTQWILQYDNRMAIPTFIYALAYGHERGLTENTLAAMENIFQGHKWYPEIKSGVEAIKSGRDIFRTNEWQPAPIGFMDVARKNELKAMAKGKCANISSEPDYKNPCYIYHCHLLWLRPVDIPLTPAMQKSAQAILSAAKSGTKQPLNASDIEDFMITPSDLFSGMMPVEAIVDELQDACTTNHLQEYFAKFKERQVTGLYFAAKTYMQEGDKKRAMDILRRLLKMQPTHKFAKNLLRHLTGSTTTKTRTCNHGPFGNKG